MTTRETFDDKLCTLKPGYQMTIGEKTYTRTGDGQRLIITIEKTDRKGRWAGFEKVGERAWPY